MKNHGKNRPERSKDYQGINYGHKLHPDEQFESVDDEHEPPCPRQVNNLIGCGGEDDVRLLETRYEREGDVFDT